MAKSRSGKGIPRSLSPVKPPRGRVNVHVDLRNGVWVVRVRRSVKSTHETQEEAVDAALELARKTEVDVVVHAPDGSIESRLSGLLAVKMLYDMWKSIHENPERWEFE